MFLTGSGAGIVLVDRVDGNRLATAGNAVVKALSEGYWARTRDPAYLVRVKDRA
jgi:hypothetical protein